MKLALIVILLLINLFFISGCEISGKMSQTNQRILESATIVKVIDGDTIVTNTGETIRLLHINAPEKGEKCYEEAKAILKELVENKTVWLERDMQNKDKYNRSLRYVYLNNSSMVNKILVEEGFVITYILLPNTKYEADFFKAEEKAIANKAGCLWQNRSNYYKCIEVEELKNCEEGDYVVLKNNCNSINITGWNLRDQSRSHYLLNGIIENNSTIKIERKDWQTTHDCIWNSYSNTLYLFDNKNQLVLRHHY